MYQNTFMNAARVNFKMIPMYQTDNYSLLQIKEKNVRFKATLCRA